MRHLPESESFIVQHLDTDSNASDGATYGYETEDILSRTEGLCNELRQYGREVLSVSAGMRPSRHGGARVERTVLEIGGRKRDIVHNYGAGGTGFQAGYGMAVEAVDAAADILRDLRGTARPKL